MELHRDEPLYPGAPNRRVSVAPKGSESEIILFLPDENWEHYRQVVGRSRALTLDVTAGQGYPELPAKQGNRIKLRFRLLRRGVGARHSQRFADR